MALRLFRVEYPHVLAFCFYCNDILEFGITCNLIYTIPSIGNDTARILGRRACMVAWPCKF